jgi:hypothetical protein
MVLVMMLVSIGACWVGWEEGGHYVYERGRRVYRPYGYRERFYFPPPVIYAPPPPPGISIFFPPFLIHP